MLVQYKSQSLIEHIRNGWVLAPIQPTHFITVVPPQMREGPEWFQGTADAVYQNMNLIEPNDPDLVAVFGADHVYRMDVRAMARFHASAAADVTISALPVPLAEASAFGVIDTDADGRVVGIRRKAARPRRCRAIRARRSRRWATICSTPTCWSARCARPARRATRTSAGTCCRG